MPSKYEIKIMYEGKTYELSGFGNPQDNPVFKKLPQEVRDKVMEKYEEYNNKTFFHDLCNFANDRLATNILGILCLMALMDQAGKGNENNEGSRKRKLSSKSLNILPSAGKTLDNISDDYPEK